MSKKLIALIILLATIFFAIAIVRDIGFLHLNGFGDLRNRVVGARLIKNEQSPYFYKWKVHDGPKYFDPYNNFPLPISNITASPLFLHCMWPIADKPQKNIAVYWLVIQYVLCLLIFGIAYFFTTSKKYNILLLLVASLFLLTAPWIAHTSFGQNYIFIPFLLIVLYFIYTRQHANEIVKGFFCGLLAVVLVLFRPLMAVFFIPFLFDVKQLNKYFIIAALLPVITICSWIGIDKKEGLYWKEYFSAITENVAFHQNKQPPSGHLTAPPEYVEIEGINIENSNRFLEESAKKVLPLRFQTASVYKNFTGIFNKKIPVTGLHIMAILSCALLLYFYCARSKIHKYNNVFTASLLGFCLYFITDIFSPVYRGQYAAVVWAFPVALLIPYFKKSLQNFYILFFVGFILNVFYANGYKMQYAIGEYIMFAALLLIVFCDHTLKTASE